MSKIVDFEEVARIPAPGDNVAIAIRRIEAGEMVRRGAGTFSLPYTVLEGHRFACAPIRAGEALLSWGLPFGLALRDLAPGDYACNEKILKSLGGRHLDIHVPELPTFVDHRIRYQLDEAAFRPGVQVPLYPHPGTFQGYFRSEWRGVGTRNYIVIVGASSLSGSFARVLAQRFQGISKEYPNIDGVVPVAHTEGGGTGRPNNFDITVKTLAGFLLNPNVGAVLVVDRGFEIVNNRVIQEFLQREGYPIDQVPHRFLTLKGDLASGLREGEAIVRGWLDTVNAQRRTTQPLKYLKIGLQCGGSDAFSGVSGNPLAGWISRELVQNGGLACLAETDELIGAEPYVLANVRDAATARKFLFLVDRFQEWASWHGSSAEGNPSGGNLLRGLYNIIIKSIGAARKKDPSLRLDYVVEYGTPMHEPGFYFMDSPGNDLESIAGQVASGCNLIIFTTGNGSITNFPFVPTIKVMTNSGRFQLLANEMDINAGRYLEGTSMDELGRDAFAKTVRVASGEKSAGERAGHSQVQLWREWRQNDLRAIEAFVMGAHPPGIPLPARSEANLFPVGPTPTYRALQSPQGPATDQVGLIIPTSLCSGQVGRQIAEQLNRELAAATDRPTIVRRFVALPHTEGCGIGGPESEELHLRTMAGYLTHPNARLTLLLEHGCEKTHNDAVQNYLDEHGMHVPLLGKASIQLDGGIDNVTGKVVSWFASAEKQSQPAQEQVAGLETLRLGVVTLGQLPDVVAEALAWLCGTVAQAGGRVILPTSSSSQQSRHFLDALLAKPRASAPEPTLAYGAVAQQPGLQIMDCPSDHVLEAETGLGAAGAEIILLLTDGAPAPGNPFVATLQGCYGTTDVPQDFDFVIAPETAQDRELAQQLLQRVLAVASRELVPRSQSAAQVDFQITRGRFGFSL